MKASVCPKYGKADIIVLKDVLKPLPKDDEIIVKVELIVSVSGNCLSIRASLEVIAIHLDGNEIRVSRVTPS